MSAQSETPKSEYFRNPMLLGDDDSMVNVDTYNDLLRSHIELERQLSAPGAGLDDRKWNPDEVICPACTHQFHAIPVSVQEELAALRAPQAAPQGDKLERALALINKAIVVLQQQIVPDGISDHEALCELHGIFDGPEYRAMLSAAPSAPAARGWQPIETAPKEGQFLVYLPTNDRQKIQAAWHRLNGQGQSINIIGNHFSFDVEKPTHWMPLPDAPVLIVEDKR